MLCTICKEDKEVKIPGKYSNILVCGHVTVSIAPQEVIKISSDNGNKPSIVEATQIANKLTKSEELPQIDTQEIIQRVLASMSQHYEDFFTSENPIMEDIINKYGNDKAVLIFTAIHSHMSHILFAAGRFKNLYYTKIEAMRKEIEDKAVKELIANHNFYYDDKQIKKPVKPRSPKLSTDMDKAKVAMGQLLDKDGKPLDVTKVMASLMWGKSKEDLKKDAEKQDYKEGLDRIKDSITKRD